MIWAHTEVPAWLFWVYGFAVYAITRFIAHYAIDTLRAER